MYEQTGVEYEPCAAAAATREIQLPEGAAPPPLTVLDPEDPASVSIQTSRLHVLLTQILPAALADSARQAVLLRNAKWEARTEKPPTPEEVAAATVRTRQAVLRARLANSRARDPRLCSDKKKKMKKKDAVRRPHPTSAAKKATRPPSSPPN